MQPVRVTPIHRLEPAKRLQAVDDPVAVEEPLEIRVEGKSIAVVMRTPGADQELAAGFLLTEGVIKSRRDIFDLATCVEGGSGGNVIDVALVHPGSFDSAKYSRHVFTSSSCGICGKTSIASVMRRRKPLRDPVRVSARTILSLGRRLTRRQTAFQTTGGMHACALFSAEGELLDLHEDVGRHNALDKLIGHALLERRLPLAGHIVLLSGRASFEMMQKALVAGIPVVAAIGAPSSLAVDFARESGQTLCGFVRERKMNIYAGRERITP